MIVFSFLRPETTRIVLLIAIGVCYLGYHLNHMWRRWRRRHKVDGNTEVADDGSVPVARSKLGAASCRRANSAVPDRRTIHKSGAEEDFVAGVALECVDDSLTGEELYAKARSIPHQPIPEFEIDSEYLWLLGLSAEKGYPKACWKLGNYAVRRGAWVEAYYWMSLAKLHGMHDLDAVLRTIRTEWSSTGFQEQISNVNEIFTEEAGSIGRALLHIDAGQAAAKAKEFLKAYHPEFL